MKRLRETFAEKLDIPKDVMLDLPRISVCGDKELYIENHKGIAQYSDSSIRVKSDDGIISVTGTFLRIIRMQSDRIIINGEFERVEYEKIGRKLKNV